MWHQPLFEMPVIAGRCKGRPACLKNSREDPDPPDSPDSPELTELTDS